jgi:outer membrane protein assembly factor BamB
MRCWLCALTLLILLSTPLLAEEDYLAPEALRDAGLVKYWQARVPLEPDQRLRDVFLVDDVIYLGTQDGWVYSVHAPTGVIRWLRPVTRSGYEVRPPCHAGDYVIFATPTDLQIYDRFTGEPIRRHEFSFPAGSAPATNGSQIFIGGLNRRLYVFGLDNLMVDWQVVANGTLVSRPVLKGPDLYFASDDGTLYACTQSDKALLWQVKAYDRITSDLALSENGVLAPCRDQSLYLLDFATGRVLWRARFNGMLLQPPVVTADTVYQFCPADGLVAVEGTPSAIEQRLRWKMPAGLTALTEHDSSTFVLTRDERVVAVDTKTGQEQAAIPAPGFTLGIPAPDQSTVFIAAPDGRLFCARPKGVPPLSVAEVRRAQRAPGSEQEEEAAAAADAARRSAAKRPDYYESRRRGPIIGGKSKVSREFEANRRAQ